MLAMPMIGMVSAIPAHDVPTPLNGNILVVESSSQSIKAE